MTDKQIIIDGVDVSGCEFYQIEANELYPKANYCGSMRNTFCEIEPNCYYKQLKRSEAQCEAMFVTHTDLEKKYKAKEQECEELKKANIHIDNNRMVKSNKLKKIEEYCRKQNLKADYTACEILQIIDEVE